MTEYTKGSAPKDAHYAKGGAILTQTSRFMKTPDTFRTNMQRTDYEKKSKGGEMACLTGDDKSLTPIKPRK